MSKNINVNPAHYKVAGRERQGEDINQHLQKQAFGERRAEVERWQARQGEGAPGWENPAQPTADPESHESQPSPARRAKPQRKAIRGRQAARSKQAARGKQPARDTKTGRDTKTARGKKTAKTARASRKTAPAPRKTARPRRSATAKKRARG